MAAFSLLRLPHLPVKLVILLLDLGEIIKLSMTSKKIEEFVKMMKYKIEGFQINLKIEKPFIELFLTETVSCKVYLNRVDEQEVPSFNEKNNKISWYQDDVSDGLNIKSTDPFKDIFCVSKMFHSQFQTFYLHWKLHLEELKTIDLSKLLSVILVENCQKISILDGDLDSALLNFIMNTVPPEIRLSIKSTIPSDFRHENAFTFHCSEYKNGVWVTIEDLFTIRDICCIKLETTNFDCNDLNRFLHYWANCEHDMMKYLTVNLRDGAEKDLKALFHQLTFFKNGDKNIPTYFILSKKDEETKRFIGRVRFLGDSIEFATFFKAAYSHARVLFVLKLFQRQKDLISKYAEITDEENEYQVERAQTIRGSTERTRVEEELTRIRIVKEEMETEFYEIIATFENRGTTGYATSIVPHF